MRRLSRCACCGSFRGFEPYETARDPDDRDTELLACVSCTVVTPLFDPRFASQARAPESVQASDALDFYTQRPALAFELEREISDHQGILSFLDAHLPDAAGSTLLELGYGRGLLMLAAARRFGRVMGMELQHRPFQALSARIGGIPANVTLVDAAALPPQPFDVLVSWHSLEHLVDPRGVLRRLSVAFKPGGLFYGQVPLFRPQYLCRTHYWFHNARSMRRLLASLGLEPVSITFDTRNGFMTFLGRKPVRRRLFT